MSKPEHPVRRGGRTANEEDSIKVVVFVQIEPKDETGAMPSDDLLAAMGAYNEELVKAGVMLEVGGLRVPSVTISPAVAR
nr:YciI family protein [Patulibacter americanus]